MEGLPRWAWWRRVACGMVLALAVCASSAEARTLFVRSGGDDGNDGFTPATALRTIGKAAALAEPGDDVLVGPGTYAEGNIMPAAFGQVRFIADRRGTSTGDPPGAVVLDATGFVTGFELNRQLAMTIDGFVVYGASIAIYVKTRSHQAIVSNNVVCNNSTNGIYIQDSRDAVIFNNLVYNNGRTGILITGNTEGSPGAVVVNNTVYRNFNRGIFFAGTTVGSPRGVVLNNIVQDNAIAGIQVNVTSLSDYVGASNVSFGNRFASGTPIDVTDVQSDPLFVDPDGADDILGGAGFADDDFRLSQVRAGQTATSPAVDAGAASSRETQLDRASTSTDGRHDRGIVDAGYHYGNFERPPDEPQLSLRTDPLYVHPTGSDANNGLTRDKPFRTLKHALTKARPGHRIVLAGGTYREGVITISVSGKPGRPLIIQGVEGAVIDAGGAKEALVLNSVHDVILDRVHVTGASEDGIEIRDFIGTSSGEVPTIWLRLCRLYGNGDHGLQVRHPISVRMSSCIVENNGERGIQIQGGKLTVERSKIRNNALTGLWAFNGASVTLLDTDVTDNTDDGVLVEKSQVSITRGKMTGSLDGGVRLRDGSTGILTNVVVTDNTDIGVQAISSALTVVGGRIERNYVGAQTFLSAVNPKPAALTIDGTRIADNRSAGIDAQQTALRVSSATIHANGRDGILLKGGTLEASQTSITSHLEGGVLLRGGVAGVLDQVDITDNEDLGVQVRSSQVTVTGGRIERNGVGIQAFPFSLEPFPVAVSVDGTRIFGNVLSGIDAQETALSVSSSTVSSNGRDGIRLKGGSLDVLASSFVDNLEGGIAVSKARHAIVREVVAERNGDNGTQLDNAGQIVVAVAALSDNRGDGLTINAPNKAPTTKCLGDCDGNGTVSVDELIHAVNIALGSASLSTCRSVDRNEDGVVSVDEITIAASNALNGCPAGAGGTLPSVAELSEIVACNNFGSGLDLQRASVTLTKATGCSNRRDGLRFKEGPIDVSESSFRDNLDGGIAVTDGESVRITDVIVGGNRDNGAQVVRATSVVVSDSVFFDNTGDGLTIMDVPGAEVSNNLVYRNGSSGIQIRGDRGSAEAPRVSSNTFYRNNNRGLFIVRAPNGWVSRNIFRGNGVAGLQASGTSAAGYVGDYNLNTDPYGFQTPVGRHDILQDPMWVDPDSGDFHLSHRAAGQVVNSPAIDSGDVPAASVGMGAKTTRTDGVPDTGNLDLGYHYRR